MSRHHLSSHLAPYLDPYLAPYLTPYPTSYQVYDSATRLDLDPSRLVLGKGDFAAALNKVVPASRRGVGGSPAKVRPSPFISGPSRVSQ